MRTPPKIIDESKLRRNGERSKGGALPTELLLKAFKLIEQGYTAKSVSEALGVNSAVLYYLHRGYLIGKHGK